MNRRDFREWLNSWPGDECRVELHRNVWGRWELRASTGLQVAWDERHRVEYILELRVNEGEGEKSG